jgi:hypothetical protein
VARRVANAALLVTFTSSFFRRQRKTDLFALACCSPYQCPGRRLGPRCRGGLAGFAAHGIHGHTAPATAGGSMVHAHLSLFLVKIR